MNAKELRKELEHWRRVANDAEQTLARELKAYAKCLLEAREESSRLRLEIAALEIQLNKPQ